MMSTDEYEAGRRDGRIDSCEKMQSQHSNRLDHHEKRLQAAERIIYALIGALMLIEATPFIKGFL